MGKQGLEIMNEEDAVTPKGIAETEGAPRWAKAMKALRQSASGAIAAADAKATAMLSLVSVLVGLMLIEMPNSDSATNAAPTSEEKMAFFVFAVFALAAALTSIVVLWPRVNRKRLLRSRSATTIDSLKNWVAKVWAGIRSKRTQLEPIVGELERSPTFFGDLATMGFDQFVKSLDGRTLEAEHQDDVEQAYILNFIAARKMYWSKFAVVFTGLAITALAVLAIIRVVCG